MIVENRASPATADVLYIICLELAASKSSENSTILFVRSCSISPSLICKPRGWRIGPVAAACLSRHLKSQGDNRRACAQFQFSGNQDPGEVPRL